MGAVVTKTTMNPTEAATILLNVAERQEALIGDIAAMGWDERKLLESSGDLEVIEALRLGAAALERR
jgi:hypothetical protein